MKYLITLALSLVTFGAQAQIADTLPPLSPSQAPPAPEKLWTLDECMLYAAENSPQTNIQEAQNRITGQDYLEAIGRFLPSLNAGVGAEFNFGRSLVDYNYLDANAFSNTYQASSDLTIFRGLQNINNMRLQKVNRIMGRQQLEARRDEVAYATMEAFFNLLYYKEMVALAEQQWEESRRNLLQTERMTELGLKGFPDVAEMRAQEASDSYNLTRQRNMMAIGVILLKEKMNFPVDGELDIASYDFGAAADKTPETAAAIYDRALDYLPQARVAASSVRSSEMALKIARGGRFPSLTMNAGYWTGYSDLDAGNFSEQFKGKRRYWVGASLNIPIFNGFSTHANVRRTKHRLTIARLESDQTLRTLYTEIEQAVADMNGAADQCVQAVRQTEFTSVAHDVNRRKYEEGLVSALELHTSSNRLMEARASELNSRLTYILKKRMVDYYSGVPLLDPQTTETTEN